MKFSYLMIEMRNTYVKYIASRIIILRNQRSFHLKVIKIVLQIFIISSLRIKSYIFKIETQSFKSKILHFIFLDEWAIQFSFGTSQKEGLHQTQFCNNMICCKILTKRCSVWNHSGHFNFVGIPFSLFHFSWNSFRMLFKK